MIIYAIRFISMLLLLIVLLGSTPLGAAKLGGSPPAGNLGWASVRNGTMVTAGGSLLRGPRWDIDIFPGLPTAETVYELRSRGFNALHIYAEAFGCGYEPGEKLSQIQTLHQHTRDAGLYLIITIGNAAPDVCPDSHGWDPELNYQNFDADFSREFWEIYAPAFADQPDVIFELQNEPYFNTETSSSQPVPPETRALQRDLYETVRRHAPYTPVLLFSYATFKDAAAVKEDLLWLNQATPIDWSRTGIAFHPYAVAHEVLEATIREIGALYPVMQTEMEIHCDGPDCYQDADWTRIHEGTGTSWLTFLRINHLDTEEEFEQLLRGPIDEANIVWPADYGDWPASSRPPTGSTVLFRTPAPFNQVVQADADVDPLAPPLIADAESIFDPGVYFDVLPVGKRLVSLRSSANGKYVDVDPQGNLEASSASPVPLEWMDRADGQVALRKESNLLFVRADHDQSRPRLVASQEVGGGPWEGFETTEAGSCPLPFLWDEQCRDCGPCAVGGANCRNDGECAAGLVCSANAGGDYGLPGSWGVCEYELQVGRLGSGSGVVTSDPAGIDCGEDCSDGFKAGLVVTLTADAAPGSVFTGWSGNPGCDDGIVTIEDSLFCAATFERDPPPGEIPGCYPDASTLCLLGGRFEVRLTWWDPAPPGRNLGEGRALPYPTADTAGFFSYVDAENLEVGIKVLDASEFNGHFWVFHGAMTTFNYRVTIRDTETDEVKEYFKRGTPLCGHGDIEAFPHDGTCSAGGCVPPSQSVKPGGKGGSGSGSCPAPPGSDYVCLLEDRFRVEVLREGNATPARLLTDQVGVVHFFSEDNPEVFFKMLAIESSESFWFFYGSMTDVDFEVVVTDTATGAVKSYTPPEPPPEVEIEGLTAFCGEADTAAFPFP